MIKKIAALFLILVVSGTHISSFNTVCAKEKLKISSLERRQMQTRLFDTNDTQKVYKSVVSALQDGGFVISIYEDQLGYMTARNDFMARRTNKLKMTGYSVLLAYYITCTVFSFGLTAPFLADPIMRCSNELSSKHVVVDANVLVEPHGKQTKVRVNFIEKVYNKADGFSYLKPTVRTVKYIDDAGVYQEFFNEISKSLFLEENCL